MGLIKYFIFLRLKFKYHLPSEAFPNSSSYITSSLYFNSNLHLYNIPFLWVKMTMSSHWIISSLWVYITFVFCTLSGMVPWVCDPYILTELKWICVIVLCKPKYMQMESVTNIHLYLALLFFMGFISNLTYAILCLIRLHSTFQVSYLGGESTKNRIKSLWSSWMQIVFS